MWKLWETRQKRENGPRVTMASAEAGSDSSHEGLMWKQLTHWDLD